MNKEEIFEVYKNISTPNNKEKRELKEMSFDMLHQMAYFADKQIEDMLKKQVAGTLETTPEVDYVIGNIIDTSNKSKQIFMEKFLKEKDLYTLTCENTKTVFMVGDEITLINGEAEKDKILEMISENLTGVVCEKIDSSEKALEYIKIGMDNGADKIMCVYNENKGFHIETNAVEKIIGKSEIENKELRKFMINFFQNLRAGKYIKELDNLMLSKLMSSKLYLMNSDEDNNTGKIGVELVENDKAKPIAIVFSSIQIGKKSNSFKLFEENNGSKKTGFKPISFSGLLGLIKSLNMYGFVVDKNDVAFYVGGENLDGIIKMKEEYDKFLEEKKKEAESKED